jgi:oligosaccharide repeat unit polymerase
MSIVSFFCFLIFLILIVTGFRKGVDFFSPARIFSLIWTLAIGLTDFKLSYLQFQWSGFGWFMLLLGLCTFLLGIYISFSINADKQFLNVRQIREQIKIQEINEKFLYKFIIVFFFAYVICYYLEYTIQGFVPLLTSEPEKARVMFGVFGLHLFVADVNVILFLVVEYFMLIKANITKKIILGVIFMIASGSFLLLLQRYNFFILFFMILCFYYYSGRKLNFKVVIVFGILITGIIIGIESLRVSKLAEVYIFYYSRMKFPYKYSFFAGPYMYVVMNLENFVKEFPHITNHSYGLFTFDFLTAFTGIKHLVLDYFNLTKFPYFIAGYNTFPFYWVYYYDFGALGLAIIPFVIGFVISEFYYKLHRNPNLVVVVLYSIGFAVIIISYSSDPLTRLDMMFNFVVTAIAQIYIIKKSQKKLA